MQASVQCLIFFTVTPWTEVDKIQSTQTRVSVLCRVFSKSHCVDVVDVA